MGKKKKKGRKKGGREGGEGERVTRIIVKCQDALKETTLLLPKTTCRNLALVVWN